MTRTIGFLLLPAFPLLSFSSAIEPLRLANRQTERTLYDWKLLSVHGGPVCAAAGVQLGTDSGLADMPDVDLLLVVAGSGAEWFKDQATFARLRQLARQRRALGAVSLGSYLLARAGLLNDCRCTVHWENLEAFREEFPRLKVTTEVFENDRDRLTCSGGTAALDMMLNYIGYQHGWELAIEVADVFMHERIRDSEDVQRMPLRTRIGVSHPKLLEVVHLMEASTDEVLSRADLADVVGLSNRQLERLFQRYLGTTPGQYYLGCRLWRARQLLRQTALAVVDIAVACGFSTASHFTKSYRKRFGITPSQERLRGAHAAAPGSARESPMALAEVGTNGPVAET